jgi:hypothetical protein
MSPESVKAWLAVLERDDAEQVLESTAGLEERIALHVEEDVASEGLGRSARPRPELARNWPRAPSRYFLAASKYGLVPLAWSVTSTTRVISGTAPVMATSIPCVRVTGAMAQP